jgi:hypothetical protein
LSGGVAEAAVANRKAKKDWGTILLHTLTGLGIEHNRKRWPKSNAKPEVG